MRDKIVCPNCGSPYIEYASLRADSGSIIGIGVPEKYYCPSCGYKGPVILEMTNEQLKKHKFNRTPWEEKKMRVDHRSAEAVKPVFTLILILFLFAAVSLMIPRYELTREPNELDLQKIGSIQHVPVGGKITITESDQIVDYGGTYYEVQSSYLSEVDRALGLQNVGGFLVPMFFMFFISGFFALLIYSHWHRVKFFS